DEQSFHSALASGMLIAAFITFGLLASVAAPYGRYSSDSVFGVKCPLLLARVAWVAMESPNLLWAAWCMRHADKDCLSSPVNLILLGCFMLHYLNRAIVFPLQMRGGKPMPAIVMALAMLFCTVNGYLQCRQLTKFRLYPEAWLTDPRFAVGLALFVAGMAANLHADGILRGLRAPGETGYKIPRGGLFEVVSGANYAAEILEWCG
ncbi:unnamed protein product, partial [Phaeothamnion confervicola]